MKANNIIYWSSTVLFSLWMIKNAFVYLTAEEAKQLCHHFGLPDYLRIELAIAKIIGIIVLLIPIRKERFKEWTYAGFTITMISGFIAHLSSGDSFEQSFSSLLALGILMASYFSYHKKKPKSKNLHQ